MSCKFKTEGSFSSVIVIHFDGTCIILVAPLVPLAALMFSWYKDVLKELLTLVFKFSAFVWIAVSLLLCGYFGNTRLLSVTFLALGAGFGGGLGMAGHGINHIDIAPRFAGVLMGITNTAGTIPGIVAPIIAKIIAQKVLYNSY